MKLLFTGASGFLGNNVRPLLEEAYDVVTMGLLPQDDYVVNIAKEIPKLRERYDIVLPERLILYLKLKWKDRCSLM